MQNNNLSKSQLINILNTASINYIVKYKTGDNNAFIFFPEPSHNTIKLTDKITNLLNGNVSFKELFNKKISNVQISMNKLAKFGLKVFNGGKIDKNWAKFNKEILDNLNIPNNNPIEGFTVMPDDSKEVINQLETDIALISQESKNGFYGVVPLVMYKVR